MNLRTRQKFLIQRKLISEVPSRASTRQNAVTAEKPDGLGPRHVEKNPTFYLQVSVQK